MDAAPATDPTRRNVLRTAAIGAASVPVLAACGGGGGDPTGAASDPTTDSSGGSIPSPNKTGGGSGGAVLAKTSDVEVGGAVFIDQPPVVITQPKSGDFHAFDRTCTHEHCLVTQLTDGLILCTCHNSVYDMTTGENVGGPAPKPLTPVEIKIQGTRIVRA